MAESQPTAPEPLADGQETAPEESAQITQEGANGEATGQRNKKGKKKATAEDAGAGDEGPPNSKGKLSTSQAKALLDMNPSLKNELGNVSEKQAAELVKKMDMASLLSGMSVGGKNQKDMASYKFWGTQPVPRFDERKKGGEEGPIKVINPDTVPAEPDVLIEGFEWVTLDLTSREELQEMYELLSLHYVEDDSAMFRFNYSESFLNWALKSPGWKAVWHVGVRASKSRKLVACIAGVPTELRVRQNTLNVTEINFLCIHKKLRAKRLAPVLIKEVTRRCYQNGIFQAVYTGGIILPTPVSTCRYYHRALNWLKLYEVGFSPLPPSSTKERQIRKNALPNGTSTPGWRPMESKDIDQVHELLNRYLRNFDFAQNFTRDEVDHWLLNKEDEKDRVVWAFVVEDAKAGRISDFVSFYCLESTVIQKKHGHENVRAAYLYYYASEAALEDPEHRTQPTEQAKLKDRLQLIMNDALIEAKKVWTSSTHMSLLIY